MFNITSMKDLLHYILDDYNQIKLAKSIKEWGLFQCSKKRFIKRDTRDNIVVSTVFLSLDHSFGNGPPILFESMVFINDDSDADCWRYSTYNEALAGHRELCIKYDIFYTTSSKEDIIENFEDLEK